MLKTGSYDRHAARTGRVPNPAPPRLRGVRAEALWNMRPLEKPTPADSLAITKALLTHGGMEGRRLVERMEEGLP